MLVRFFSVFQTFNLPIIDTDKIFNTTIEKSSWTSCLISGKRRGPPRHHSVDDDYYPYPPYGHYGYYNGYGMHYNSNPSIFRSPPSREPKYPQHPSMRFGQVFNTFNRFKTSFSFKRKIQQDVTRVYDNFSLKTILKFFKKLMKFFTHRKFCFEIFFY